jgi:hypothetical protein
VESEGFTAKSDADESNETLLAVAVIAGVETGEGNS